MARRVIAYVDGFNLYHGLTELKRRDPAAFPNKRVGNRRERRASFASGYRARTNPARA